MGQVYNVTPKVDELTRNPVKAAFAVASYLYFFYIFLYLASFLANGAFWSPNGLGKVFPGTVDFGSVAWNFESKGGRVVVDLVLASVWAVHHSVFARGFTKKWLIEKIGVPADIERSLYVFIASALAHIMFAFWQPVEDKIWGSIDNCNAYPVAFGGSRSACWAYLPSLFGILFVLASSFMIDHFDLFGLRQGLHLWKIGAFTDRMFYKVIRHPLMTGFFIAFWARPVMTAGGLIFALACTGYIIIGNALEERDAMQMMPEYEEYRNRTWAYFPGCPMINPLISKSE